MPPRNWLMRALMSSTASPMAEGLTCSWSPTMTAPLPRYSASSPARSHWLASSTMTTSNLPWRGSKLSATRASGMIQTGTASRARVSSSRAFSCRAGRALARPLADLPLGVGPADQRLARLQPGAAQLRQPGPAVHQLHGQLAQLPLRGLQPAGQRRGRRAPRAGPAPAPAAASARPRADPAAAPGAPCTPRRRSTAAPHSGAALASLRSSSRRRVEDVRLASTAPPAAAARARRCRRPARPTADCSARHTAGV